MTPKLSPIRAAVPIGKCIASIEVCPPNADDVRWAHLRPIAALIRYNRQLALLMLRA